MDKMNNFIKYYELSTEDGPLYYYEIYREDAEKSEIPIPIEFFTQEEGVRGFNCVEFLDRKCSYPYGPVSMQGYITQPYLKELSPYEFLEAVGPYMASEAVMEDKRKEVMTGMKFKAGLTNYRMIKIQRNEINQKQKDEVATKILKKYMKTK